MLKVAVSYLLFLTCLLLLRRQANLSLLRFRYNVLLNDRQCIILSFTCFPFLSQSRCFGEKILFSINFNCILLDMRCGQAWSSRRPKCLLILKDGGQELSIINLTICITLIAQTTVLF